MSKSITPAMVVSVAGTVKVLHVSPSKSFSETPSLVVTVPATVTVTLRP